MSAPDPDTVPAHTVQPHTVVDPTTGRPILMAPQRQKRPMHTGSKASSKRCPFCSGHEQDTPTEVDAARLAGTNANQPGWTVRAFANLYPATVQHEVIAEGAEHREHPCDLDVSTWRDAITVWQRRILAVEATDGTACAFLFKNVGARAGASIAHNHSQVIGLPELPPRLELERSQQRSHGRCLTCATLSTAGAEQRIVVDTARVPVRLLDGQARRAGHRHAAVATSGWRRAGPPRLQFVAAPRAGDAAHPRGIVPLALRTATAHRPARRARTWRGHVHQFRTGGCHRDSPARWPQRRPDELIPAASRWAIRFDRLRSIRTAATESGPSGCITTRLQRQSAGQAALKAHSSLTE